MAVSIIGWLTLHWAGPQGRRCPPLTLAQRSRRSFLCIPQSGRMITDNWRKKLEYHRLVRHRAAHFTGLRPQNNALLLYGVRGETLNLLQSSSWSRPVVLTDATQWSSFLMSLCQTQILFILWIYYTIAHWISSLWLLQTDWCHVSSCNFVIHRGYLCYWDYSHTISYFCSKYMCLFLFCVLSCISICFNAQHLYHHLLYSLLTNSDYQVTMPILNWAIVGVTCS